MQNNQFTKTINWEGGHKLCKVYQKKDKKNNTYFIGELNNNCQLTIRKTFGQYAKEGEWEIQIFPIKYSKNNSQPPSGNNQTGNNYDMPMEGEEVPF
jgi:hypothetical protein